MQSDHNQGSITRAIASFGEIDEDAARLLWNRSFERLRQHANQKIHKRHKRLFDGEDIAGSSMFALLDGFKKGKFQQVNNRDQLWQLLTTIAARKLVKIQQSLLSWK